MRRSNAYCPNAYLLSLTVQAFGIRFAVQHIRFSAFRCWSASLASPAKYLLCLLLTSAGRSGTISHTSVLIHGSRSTFVFSVCRLVSRRCHNISTIPSGSDTLQTSQGKTQNFITRKRRIYKAHPIRGWRTSWSRAHSSRVYHTSDPVPVRRPALLDWASSRPRLATTPLPFS